MTAPQPQLPIEVPHVMTMAQYKAFLAAYYVGLVAQADREPIKKEMS